MGVSKERIYGDNATEYFEAGFSVTPLHGKRAFIDGWQNSNDESLIDTHPNNNIGLLIGEKYKIVVADIDTKDVELRKKIDKILPPSPVMRLGSKDKSPSRFYKYNSYFERKKQLGSPIDGESTMFEVLSTGGQVMIPPSIHPEGHACQWIGQSILDFDIDDLPELLPEDFEKIAALAGQSSSTNSGGRNDTLKSFVGGKLEDGKPIGQIAQELFEYDRDNNTPPLFSDTNEYRNGMHAEYNAMLFTMNIIKSVKPLKISISEPTVLFEFTKTPEIERIDYKRHKLPHLRGIAGDMFKYIYDNSPIPRSQLAFASALTTTSLIIGNKISYRGTLPNLFTVMLAPSGTGKDFPLQFPLELLSAAKSTRYIGDMPASDTAVLMNLDKQNHRIDVIDEASGLFGGMSADSGKWSRDVANAYQKLYTSSGKYHTGKSAKSFANAAGNDMGRIGECFNPYVNILATMTIEDFGKTFTSDLVDKGLGGRFIYFADDEPKAMQFKDRYVIPKDIIHFAEKNLVNDFNFQEGSEQRIQEVSCDSRTKSYIIDCMRDLDNRKLSVSNDNILRPILNRSAQLMIKMALIDQASIKWDYDVTKISLTKDSVDWSMRFIEKYLLNMKVFLDHNLSSGGTDKILKVMEKVILDNDGRISLTQFGRNTIIRKLNLNSSERKKYIQTLKDDGIIQIGAEQGANFIYHETILK